MEFNATSVFSGGNPPTLEVLVGGVVLTSIEMQLGTNTYEAFLEFSGLSPSSLSFRFAGSSGDLGDTITFNSVTVNRENLNVGSDLSTALLIQGVSSSVTLPSAESFGYTPPTLGTTTITGTGSDDPIVQGSSTADVIDAMAGNDYITARGGDDQINGGDGDDYIFGEGGADTILGGAGNDVIFGNDDDDVLFGEADNDYLIGGNGSDFMNGGSGDDGLLGDAGDDIMFGEDGMDYMSGDAGDDIMFGDGGNDFLYGGIGNDAISGGDGNDQIIGGEGDDLMSGGTGNDEIVGEDGNDEADGGGGSDKMYGGDGNDTFYGGENDDYVSGGDGDDTLYGDGGADAVIGGNGADTIDGGNGDDILHGHGLDAMAVSNILFANPSIVYSQETGSFYQLIDSGFNISWTAAQAAANATTINGVGGHLAVITTQVEQNYIVNNVYDGNNAWLGGSDVDNEGIWQWEYGPEAGMSFWDEGTGSALNNAYTDWTSGQPNDSDGTQDYLYLLNNNNQWADATITGGSGFVDIQHYVIEWDGGLFADDDAIDTISGGDGSDWIYGWGGDDVLNGDNGDDYIFGGLGNDVLNGGADNDYLLGGFGSDNIDGGNGDDIIYVAVVGTVGAQTVVNTGGGGPILVTLIDEAFGSNTGVFTYSDVTDPGNAHAVGTRNTGDGAAATGSLEVDIGRNGSTYGGAEGHWTTTLSYGSDVTNAQLTLSYRHIHNNQNDFGEDSDVYVIINGTRYDQFGGNGYISSANGSGPAFDSGWQTITINLPDLTANTTYTLELGMLHTGSNVNNEDATVRFDDVTLSGNVSTLYIIDEDFTLGSGVFTYADNVFGGTDTNGYANGAWIVTDGDNAPGALRVQLAYGGGGGQSNYSGGWVETFSLANATDNITLDFSYKLLRDAGFENNEDAYVYVEVDNVRYGIDPNDYIEYHEGDGNGGANYNSGWVNVTLDIGTLSAGSHTVEIGVFHEGSTVTSEVTELRLDDIQMIAVSGTGGNDATSSGNDVTESHNIDGGAGNDIIYGSAGDDYLYGGAGSDTIYSDSLQEYTVADALAELAGVVYNEDTGSFYYYVSAATTAPTAFANAATTMLNGVAGHIVHVTSALENAYIDTLTGTATTWMGAQDTAVEGEWRWVGGVNDGDLFWLGNFTGSLQGGYTYENWNGLEPNDYVGGEDYVEIQNGGGWNDNGGPNNNALSRGYVIEWEASEVFSFGSTVLNGGEGADDLYGSQGADLFIFDFNVDTFSNPDTVFNFDANDGDALDISDILSGLSVTSANISNYVDVSEANGLRVDITGSSSFGAGSVVASFSGFTGVSDEASMLANGNLIIY